MWTRSKQSFLIDGEDKQMPVTPNSYIFDETYKTKLQKNKFQRNPKYAYFNTVIKIKNRLSQQHHDIYEMMFDPQITHQQSKWKNINLKNKFHTGTFGIKDKHHMSQYCTDIKNQGGRINSTRNSNSRHIRKRSQIFYDSKPRLDDILAQYRRMNHRQSKQKQRNKSFYLNQNKRIIQEFKLFNKTGRLLPRQLSQPPKSRKTPKF